MTRLFRRLLPKKRAHTAAIEHEHDLRLAAAQSTLRDLTMRGETAVDTLDQRDRRNHWQEAVQAVIRGAH